MDESTNSNLLPPKLKKTTSPKKLAELLKTTYSALSYQYYVTSKSTHYSVFSIPKKSGGARVITAPSSKLKTIQKRLSELLSEIYSPHPKARAFIKGVSLKDNAIPHVRKTYVFNIDLIDFFNSITFARVRGLLIAKPYELQHETASVIAHLATFNGVLPQGSPCSPVISNMICKALDHQLSALARKYNAAYTRYADDITFSFTQCNRYFPYGLIKPRFRNFEINHYKVKAGDELSMIVIENGFAINHKKTRLQHKSEKQVVTGLIVNKKPNVDRRYIRKTSAMINSIEVFGLQSANEIYQEKCNDQSLILEFHIQGRLLFIKQIKGLDSEVYSRLAIRFNSCGTSCKVPTQNVDVTNTTSRIQNDFAKKCWIIENEVTIDQGSGFLLEGNILITCAHVLEDGKGGHIDSCTVYRSDGDDFTFFAKPIIIEALKDIAVLQIDMKGMPQPEFFRIEENPSFLAGSKVSILGFPSYKPSSRSVRRLWARITNEFKVHEIEYAEIDKVLYPGNSGGPALNGALNVIGIAAKGASGDEGFNAFIKITELASILNRYKI